MEGRTRSGMHQKLTDLTDPEHLSVRYRTNNIGTELPNVQTLNSRTVDCYLDYPSFLSAVLLCRSSTGTDTVLNEIF
jgi:hypothetical protein